MFIVTGIPMISFSPSGAASFGLAQRVSPRWGLGACIISSRAINMSPRRGLPSRADQAERPSWPTAAEIPETPAANPTSDNPGAPASGMARGGSVERLVRRYHGHRAQSMPEKRWTENSERAVGPLAPLLTQPAKHPNHAEATGTTCRAFAGPKLLPSARLAKPMTKSWTVESCTPTSDRAGQTQLRRSAMFIVTGIPMISLSPSGAA